ncbi:hypothetical protein [uncultured Pontibacter sp.]|uniref:hypothetical protein n=1 Tax=uncultured Pontibacter sp. TaxID=453356 RepID=UPI00260E4875|nr:hypothetical protein [uncultured Pontibacter sp.]
MEILTWKQEGFTARKYTVSGNNGLVGRLDFKGWTSFDADFSSERINLAFRRQGWLEHEVTISFKGEVVGMSKTSGFGKTTTTLVTGERFALESKAFGSSRALVDAAGNTVINFDPSNFGGTKGNIAIHSEIPELTKLLLVATGLYFKTLADSQAAVMVAVFTPIFLQIIR